MTLHPHVPMPLSAAQLATLIAVCEERRGHAAKLYERAFNRMKAHRGSDMLQHVRRAKRLFRAECRYEHLAAGLRSELLRREVIANFKAMFVAILELHQRVRRSA